MAIASAFVTLVFTCATGDATAATGLAPVSVDGDVPPELVREVEAVLYRELQKRGRRPPRPRHVGKDLGLTSRTEKVSTERCVEVGRDLGLDLLVVVRIVRRQEGSALEAEVAIVVTKTGEEISLEAEIPTLETADRRPWRVEALEVMRVVGEGLDSLADSDPDRQLAEVEMRLERDCDLEYDDYLKDRAGVDQKFTDYMKTKASRRMKRGKVTALVVPPTLIVATTIVALAVFKPWLWDDRERENAEPNGEDHSIGLAFDRMWFSFTLIGGYGSSIAILASALHSYFEGRNDLRLLRGEKGSRATRAEVAISFAPQYFRKGAGAGVNLAF